LTNCSRSTHLLIALIRTSKSSLEMKRRGSDSAKTIRGDFVTIKRGSANIRRSLKSKTFIRTNLLRCSPRGCICRPRSQNLRNHTMILRRQTPHHPKSSWQCLNHSLVPQKWTDNKIRLSSRVASRAIIVKVKLLKTLRLLTRWRIDSKTTVPNRTMRVIPNILCHNREEWRQNNRSVSQRRKGIRLAHLRPTPDKVPASHLQAQSKPLQ